MHFQVAISCADADAPYARTVYNALQKQIPEREIYFFGVAGDRNPQPARESYDIYDGCDVQLVLLCNPHNGSHPRLTKELILAASRIMRGELGRVVVAHSKECPLPAILSAATVGTEFEPRTIGTDRFHDELIEVAEQVAERAKSIQDGRRSTQTDTAKSSVESPGVDPNCPMPVQRHLPSAIGLFKPGLTLTSDLGLKGIETTASLLGGIEQRTKASRLYSRLCDVYRLSPPGETIWVLLELAIRQMLSELKTTRELAMGPESNLEPDEEELAKRFERYYLRRFQLAYPKRPLEYLCVRGFLEGILALIKQDRRDAYACEVVHHSAAQIVQVLDAALQVESPSVAESGDLLSELSLVVQEYKPILERRPERS